MRINVKSYHFGWDTPITVQRFYSENNKEPYVVWCNHANSKLEHGILEFMVNDHMVERQARTEVCDKCGAWRAEGHYDYLWNGSPEDGLHS